MIRSLVTLVPLVGVLLAGTAFSRTAVPATALPPSVEAFLTEQGVASAARISCRAATSPARIRELDIEGSVWQTPGQLLLLIHSQAPHRRLFYIDVDWKQAGLEYGKSSFYAPPLEGAQEEAVYARNEPVFIEAGQTLIVVIDHTPHPTDPNQLPHGWQEEVAPRALLVQEKLSTATPDNWRAHLSSGAGTQAVAGGLRFSTPANVCAFLERKLPAGTAAVGLLLDRSTDGGMSWGPGLSLLWPEGAYLQVNCRMEGRYNLVVNGEESQVSSSSSSGQALWILLDEKHVRVLAQGDDEPLARQLYQTKRADFPGAPERVRIGKLGLSLKPNDHGDRGRDGTFTLLEWQARR